MTSTQEALKRLQEGNRHFASDVGDGSVRSELTRRSEVASQKPFAIVLGCSDSRVPPEIIFDQRIGNLFVIRVAGNIATPTQIGSVEFAAEQFGTRLVVVLGHSECGAVAATLEELQNPMESKSPNLRAIIDQIRPSVEPLLEMEPRLNADSIVQCAVRANVQAAADCLRHGSPLLGQLLQRGKLLVVGAEYSLETGIVDFFDGLPEVA